MYGGTGLGLAIVKQIVEFVGGGVSVTSKEDVGTSFHVRIPFKIVVCFLYLHLICSLIYHYYPSVN